GGGGSFTPKLNGVSATSALSVVDEVQTIDFSGVQSGTPTTLFFNSLPGSPGLTYQIGSAPTQGDVKTHLESIAGLAGNVDVQGNDGGPFTVTFIGALNGQNVS